MKRRIFSILLLIGMMFSMVAGCKYEIAANEGNVVEDEDDEDEEKSYKFGFTCLTMDNPFFITLEQSLRDTLEEEGHTLVTMAPDYDVELQITQIDEMITDGIDALFLAPVDWNKITPALEHLKEAGVKIINIDSEVKEFDYVDAYIGSDNKEAGAICAERIIELYPKGGKILLLESRKQNSVNERIRGFEEKIANKGFEIVTRVDAQGDLNIAWEMCHDIFEQGTDIDIIMCGNDQSALGALVAANRAGLGDVRIIGVDGSPDIKKELVKSDTIVYGTCAQSPVNVGQEAARIGMAVLNGDKFERITHEEVFFIDADNVHTYGIDGWQ